MLTNHCAIFIICGIFFCSLSVDALDRKPKSILTALLARNKQHTLPYFLTIFSNLNYPKDRISLFIRSDHNSDRTTELINEWLSVHQGEYHSVDIVTKDDQPNYPNEWSPSNWTESRFDHIISLKNEALYKAKRMWADYIWFLDVDAFIVDPDILWHLIDHAKPIISPMLNSLGTYSNFWCGMTESYWYERTEDYLPILNRKQLGCFSVPMVHSCVLVDLSFSASDLLSFDSTAITSYDGPKDDIIIFALGAKQLGMEMHICNSRKYGFIPSPLNADEKFSKDYQYLTDIKLEALVEFPPFPVSPELVKYAIPLPPKQKLGFDNIYLINLIRRPDRKERMLRSFDELGISAQVFDAVDGMRLNATYLEDIGFKQLHNYKDPWSKRDMTYGEIGCFLSHFYIWQDIVHNGYEQVLVFEDDIRFQPFFLDKVRYMMKQIKDIDLEWDFIYLGRKILKDSDEPWVEDSDILVHAHYSYWTLCYIITLEGAQKLLHPNPLRKMIPVDEYIPIMFDQHPEESWKAEFYPRTLKAFSAAPLMVHPTHYTGDDGYISDTETSTIIEEELRLEVHSPIGPPSLHQNTLELDIGLNDLRKEEL